MMNTKDYELIVLGCGGSGGVPLVTGFWGDCNPDNPKNRRMRASVAVRTANTCIVVDTGPDFHVQTLEHGITDIDAIMYTHEHADHINGIDDVRYVAIKKRILGDKGYMTPIYGEKSTIDGLHSRFEYIFNVDPSGLYVPLIESHVIEPYKPFRIGDIDVIAVSQIHGAGKSLGYIFGDIAYSTDVSGLTDEALEAYKGIKTWIVDCGQFGSDSTSVHANYKMVLEWNETVGAERLILTHLKASEDYDAVNKATPDYIEPAYDGMVIKFNPK